METLITLSSCSSSWTRLAQEARFSGPFHKCTRVVSRRAIKSSRMSHAACASASGYPLVQTILGTIDHNPPKTSGQHYKITLPIMQKNRPPWQATILGYLFSGISAPISVSSFSIRATAFAHSPRGSSPGLLCQETCCLASRSSSRSSATRASGSGYPFVNIIPSCTVT